MLSALAMACAAGFGRYRNFPVVLPGRPLSATLFSVAITFEVAYVISVAYVASVMPACIYTASRSNGPLMQNDIIFLRGYSASIV